MRAAITCIIVLLYLQAHAQVKVKNDSVVFYNKDRSIRYGGTLTIPSDHSKHPAIILISGTGQQNRDGLMGDHYMFRALADFLGRQGYIVLRTDDRGVGKTSGDYEKSTSGDFADDALEAVRFLQKHPQADTNAIGLLGHSEGGMIIAIAASKSKSVKFLISLAGLAVNGYQALIEQNESLVNHSPVPDYDKKRFNEIDSLMFGTAFRYADSPDMEKQLNQTYDTWKKKDSVFFKSLHIEFDHFRFPVYSYVKQATGPWYRYFVKYNAEKVLSGIDVPILAINGAEDLMVVPASSLHNWKTLTASGQQGRVTTIELDHMNHLLLDCVTCTAEEQSTIRQDISPRVLEAIKKWLANGHAAR